MLPFWSSIPLKIPHAILDAAIGAGVAEFIVERNYCAGLSPATVGSAWSALLPPPDAFMPSIAPPFSSSGAGATLFFACWGWESGFGMSVLNL
jgi:hypothetical protein